MNDPRYHVSATLVNGDLYDLDKLHTWIVIRNRMYEYIGPFDSIPQALNYQSYKGISGFIVSMPAQMPPGEPRHRPLYE